MGLVERLKQEKAEEAAKVLHEQQLKAQQKAEELQAEAIERDRRAQRKQQAERFREESGVGSLIQEVKEIVSGSGYEKIDIKGVLNLEDPDSAYDFIVWGSTVIRIGKEEPYVYELEKGTGRRISTWGEPYVYRLGTSTGRRRLVDYDGKFIVVESQPNGNILFHGNEKTEVLVQDWKNNKSVLGSALEKSYDSPGFMYYSKYIDDDGHGRMFEGSNGFNARFTLDTLLGDKVVSGGGSVVPKQIDARPFEPGVIKPYPQGMGPFDPGPHNPSASNDPRGSDPRGPSAIDPRGPR